MKKLLCVATVVAMCVVPAMGQTTLELRVTSGGSATVAANPGDSVPVEIRGDLTGDASLGLALWSTNVTNTGDQAADLCDRIGVLFVDAPAGTMQFFKRNLGLTNPGPTGGTDTTGYSGTCDGAMGLWQVGGGLNTINNTGPTLYPIGTPIPTGVAESGEIILAEGTFTLPDLFTGTNVILTLGSAFANVITDDTMAPVYGVEEAQIAVTGDLTITGAVAPDPVVVTAWSFGEHGAPVNADLGVQIAGAGATSDVEARTIDGGPSRVYLTANMDLDMATASVSINPAVAGISASVDGGDPSIIVIEFLGSAPADDTCYQLDLAGSTSTGGGTEQAGDDFCVCYNLGDVNRGGIVEGLDDGAIFANFGLAANAGGVPYSADLNRGGLVEGLDDGVVFGNFGDGPWTCP